MKIIVTGSLGNIGKPLTIGLVQKGHVVTVISSNPEKKSAIEALGATAAIGKMEDVAFLTTTFTGADAIYCMIPLNFTEPDQTAYLFKIANNYLQSLRQAGVKRVVVLSGWAADLIEGENVEGVFDALADTSITILRPASFYSNFYSSIGLMRGKGLIGALLTLRH